LRWPAGCLGVVVVVAIAMSADGASIVIAFEYEGIC